MISPRPALHRLAFVALLALASAGAAAQGTTVPAAPEFSAEALAQQRRVATDDPQVQRARWGDLALVAGKAWLQSVPGDVAAVWRDIRWIVPGAAMRYHRGFCVAQQCQGTVYLVRWDEKSGQLEFLDQGQVSYVGRVQGDGSVRLAGTGLVGVLTAEALSFDRTRTILYSDKHELKPVTAAQLADATRGMAGQVADKGLAAPAPAPSATENEKLRAELAEMKARMDRLSRQVDQQQQQGTAPGGAPQKPMSAAEAREAERRAQREAKARAAEEQRQAAETRAREQAEAKARAAEEQRQAVETRAREQAEAKARAREEAQAKAAEAQRANAEMRAREEEARRAAAEARTQAEEAKRLAAAEAAKAPRGAGASSMAVATSAPAPAAPTHRCGGVDGVYGVVSSNYRIEVKFSGDELMVVEPNRTSPYRHMGNCQYLFVHPNGTRYMLGVVSRGLVAYKEGQDDSQKTPLALIQASAAPQTDRRCTAERIPVQNVKALHPELSELFGSRGIPGATVEGTYNAPERDGHPLTRLSPNGSSGTFEVYGAPKPQFVYTIERWYIQANCDGTLVKEDHPAATRYYLIYKLDREYEGLLWHRDALDVAKSGGVMFIDDRRKALN